jgi:hypothetical protein
MAGYRRNEEFRLRAPGPGPARETRTIAGRTTLGLIINPKTKEPVLATTDGHYVGIRSLRQESLLKKLGTGYLSDSNEDATKATGYPRVHTPDGVTVGGMGYGTALYSAICDGAHLRYRDLVEISARGDGDGICSDTKDRSGSADRWWAAARRQGLTEEHTEEDEEREENVELDLEPSDLSCVETDGRIVYVNKVSVDIEKTTEITFDTYSYDSLIAHNLVAAEIVTTLPGVTTEGSDLYVLWREVLEDPDLIIDTNDVALLALDVRGLSEDAVSLLSLAYLANGQSDAAVDDLRNRWARNLDPGAGSGQGRLFKANGMSDVVEARRISGWDALSDLP